MNGYDRDRDMEPEPDEELDPEPEGPDAEENEDYPVVTGEEDAPPLVAYDVPPLRLPDEEEEGGS